MVNLDKLGLDLGLEPGCGGFVGLGPLLIPQAGAWALAGARGSRWVVAGRRYAHQHHDVEQALVNAEDEFVERYGPCRRTPRIVGATDAGWRRSRAARRALEARMGLPVRSQTAIALSAAGRGAGALWPTTGTPLDYVEDLADEDTDPLVAAWMAAGGPTP